jgi:hypothetical protein
MNINNFYIKYLKYKNKYLELKNLVAGQSGLGGREKKCGKSKSTKALARVVESRPYIAGSSLMQYIIDEVIVIEGLNKLIKGNEEIINIKDSNDDLPIQVYMRNNIGPACDIDESIINSLLPYQTLYNSENKDGDTMFHTSVKTKNVNLVIFLLMNLVGHLAEKHLTFENITTIVNHTNKVGLNLLSFVQDKIEKGDVIYSDVYTYLQIFYSNLISEDGEDLILHLYDCYTDAKEKKSSRSEAVCVFKSKGYRKSAAGRLPESETGAAAMSPFERLAIKGNCETITKMIMHLNKGTNTEYGYCGLTELLTENPTYRIKILYVHSGSISTLKEKITDEFLSFVDKIAVINFLDSSEQTEFLSEIITNFDGIIGVY